MHRYDEPIKDDKLIMFAAIVFLVLAIVAALWFSSRNQTNIIMPEGAIEREERRVIEKQIIPTTDQASPVSTVEPSPTRVP